MWWQSCSVVASWLISEHLVERPKETPATFFEGGIWTPVESVDNERRRRRMHSERPFDFSFICRQFEKQNKSNLRRNVWAHYCRWQNGRKGTRHLHQCQSKQKVRGWNGKEETGRAMGPDLPTIVNPQEGISGRCSFASVKKEMFWWIRVECGVNDTANANKSIRKGRSWSVGKDDDDDVGLKQKKRATNG